MHQFRITDAWGAKDLLAFPLFSSLALALSLYRPTRGNTCLVVPNTIPSLVQLLHFKYLLLTASIIFSANSRFSLSASKHSLLTNNPRGKSPFPFSPLVLLINCKIRATVVSFPAPSILQKKERPLCHTDQWPCAQCVYISLKKMSFAEHFLKSCICLNQLRLVLTWSTTGSNDLKQKDSLSRM